MNARIIRYDALAAADGAGFTSSPASVLVRRPDPGQKGPAHLLAAGHPGDVATHPSAAAAPVVPLPTSVLLPGLINAHTHLDLTHIGPRPFDEAAGFTGWIDMIRAERASEDAAIAASVEHGIELNLAGGTVAVGDIAGAPGGRPTLVPWRTLRRSPLLGVTFLEFFAIGKPHDRGLRAATEALREGLRAVRGLLAGGAGLGLQPHATHTVGLDAFRACAKIAADLGVPLSTHLAETAQEHEFVSTGRGEHREFLERIGVWTESVLLEYGKGRTPVEHLYAVLSEFPCLAAHVNDADDRDIRLLAQTRTTVVYCPRASEYFGAPRRFGPHRYRDMLAAGINVALGTDSIVNLPARCAEIASGGISVLDEMRYLSQRDRTDPVTLLKMGTVNAAAPLGLDPGWFVLSPKAPGPSSLAGLIAVNVGSTRLRAHPLRDVFESNSPVRPLFLGDSWPERRENAPD